MPDRILLLDSNSLIFRAFHALPPLTSQSGELTNATYGFTMMLLKSITDLSPTHVAAAFDTPKPTFRHERFDAYKGTRAPMPDGLRPQFARVMQVLETLNIPIIRVDGLEADDILGTLADRASAAGMEAIVVTGDTDALQLVGERTQVLVTRRGVTDTVLYDVAGVRGRYGLDPQQLVDLRALRGDVTDNIPGVPGVGEKTATKLLEQYQDIEQLIAHLGDLPAKQRDQLTPYVDQMRTARELAQIMRDAPIEFDFGTAALTRPDRDKVLTLFHELAFRSLIDRLPPVLMPTRPGEAPPAPARPSAGQHPTLFDAPAQPEGAAPTAQRPACVAVSLDDLAARVDALREAGGTVGLVVVLDRSDAMRAQIVGVGLAGESGESMYVPLAVPGAPEERLPVDEAMARLRLLLEDPEVPKVLPNAKQMIVALDRHHIDVRGLAFDSELAAYLIEASQRTLTLQDLSWSRLNRELPNLKGLLGTGRNAITIEAAPVDKVSDVVCQEVETLVALRPILERELAENSVEQLYREVEVPLIDVLATMERAGIAVDVPYLKELSRELGERVSALERGIFDSVGHEFNIGSPQQLGTVLFDELKLPGAKRTSTGRASTAADVLTGLKGAHPAIDMILEHRELTKLKSTYADALPLMVHPETGRIHTTFNQTVAATGRLSSQEPNLQNIPVRTELGRRVRHAFVAPEPGWKLVSADYSQIELRIQAHVSQDPTLLEAFQLGQDVHNATAAEMFGIPIEEVTSDQRRLAKTANFAIIYGISPFGFSEQTGLSQQQSAEFIRRYFERFPGVNQFQKRLLAEARTTGYVMTLMGRRRIIPELRSAIHGVRAAGERMAINAPVQGTASDIIKVAMIRLHAYMQDQRMRSRMLLQVHDELLFEAPEDEVAALTSSAKEIMEGAMTLSVPLLVEFRAAPSWGGMY
jgi:DNA polymerase I